MSLAPGRARPRPDLTFLRHRRRPATSNPVIAEFIATHSPRPGGPAGRPVPKPAGTTGPAAPRSTPPPAPTSGPRPAPAAAASLDLDAATPAGNAPNPLDLDAPAWAPSSATSLDLDAPPSEPTGATSLDLTAPLPSPSGGFTSLDLGGPPATPAGSSTPLDLDAPAPAVTGTTSLDLGGPAPASAPAPTGSTSLDLGGPAVAPPPRPASTGSTSLDLGGPRSTPASTPPARPVTGGGSTSLDLGGGGPAPGRPTPSRAGHPTSSAVWVPARADNHIPTILQPSAPEVVLDRRQSAIGTLTIDAVVGADVGDLRLGAAYQLTSGLTSTVQHSTGRRFAPAGERQRPILLASRGPGEQLEIDLRQVRDLERVVVYAFSGSGAPLHWGGTLRITTFGGARIEIPLDQPPSAVVTVIAAIHQVDGELVIRAERDLAGRTVKQACRTYGFDRISWLDDSTPVD